MLSNLVNTLTTPVLAVAPPRAAAPPPPGPAPAGPSQAVPSFITPASLVTVSGGTGAVTLLWQIARTLAGASAGSPWVPFCISLVVGAIIYLLSVGDSKVQASTLQRVIGIFIAFLNSMVLFAASFGILGR